MNTQSKHIDARNASIGVLGDNTIVHGDININPTPAPAIPTILPPLDECFLGRDKDIAKLLPLLHPGKVVAVCGPGGMGKSALAAQAVHRLDKARFPDGLVFHSFYGKPKTEDALQEICAAFQVKPEPTLEIAVRQVLAGKKALLILDGTEQADDLPAVLALRSTCGVLITSRKTEDALDELLELKPLDEKPAAEVFQAYSGIAADDPSVVEICKILDGWPVALRIAGRYLRRTKESAATYLKWLPKEPFKELGNEEHQQENAALLLRRSVAQVSADAQLALGVVGTLAFAPIALEPVAATLSAGTVMPPQGFWARVKAVFSPRHKQPLQYSAEDERRIHKALGELVNYGLLDKQKQKQDEKLDERWKISHALIHTYARTELALSTESLERLAAWYIDFCEAQSAAGLQGYAILDGERLHCLRLIESCLASKLWQEVQDLAGAIQEYLDRQGHWADQLTALSMNLTAAQHRDDRKDEAWCLNNLGYTCDSRGEYDKALAYYEQCLAIHQQLGDRKGEGVTLNNMAAIYRQQGKHELALQTYQQSLSIQQEIGDRQGEGAPLNNIAGVYYAQKDYEQALSYYEQALTIAREVGNKIGEGTTLNNIAAIYRAQGNLTKALEYLEQALEIRQQLGDRAGEAQSRWNIGTTYYNLGDLAAAEEHISLAMQIYEQINSPSLEQCRGDLKRVQAARQG